MGSIDQPAEFLNIAGFQCIDRILCAKNAEFEDARKNLGAGAQAYAWFVWQKGYKGPTTIDWI